MQDRFVPVYSTGISTGATVTSGAASANTAIPTTQSGAKAKMVLLSCVSGSVHVKLGIDNTIAATANDLLIGVTPIAVFCGGCAYIAYIQEAAASKLNIAPLES